MSSPGNPAVWAYGREKRPRQTRLRVGDEGVELDGLDLGHCTRRASVAWFT
jgi:hypothetical protein